MRTIHLLIFSAIFGFFAIIGDQSAYQVEKKIYFLNEKIETLNEELDNNTLRTEPRIYFEVFKKYAR